MNISTKTMTYSYWSPRILGIIFILFLAVFALDVFTPGKTVSYYVLALFMHLIPNIVLALVLSIAWRFEKIGGILFLLAALVFTIYFQTFTSFTNFFIVSFPLLLIGILFMYHTYLLKGSKNNDRRNMHR